MVLRRRRQSNKLALRDESSNSGAGAGSFLLVADKWPAKLPITLRTRGYVGEVAILSEEEHCRTKEHPHCGALLKGDLMW